MGAAEHFASSEYATRFPDEETGTIGVSGWGNGQPDNRVFPEEETVTSRRRANAASEYAALYRKDRADTVKKPSEN